MIEISRSRLFIIAQLQSTRAQKLFFLLSIQIQMHLPYKMHARHQHLPSEKAKTNIDTKLKYNQKWNAYNIKCVLLYSAQRSEIYRYKID